MKGTTFEPSPGRCAFVKKLAFVLLVLILAVSAAGVLYTRLYKRYRGYGGVEQFVDIPAGFGTRAIGERLVATGVIRDLLTYRLALWRSGVSKRLAAGEYRFDEPMTPIAVVTKLARGDVFVVSLTFPEGLTIAEMSRVFEARGFGPASAFAAAAGDPSLVHAIDPAARDLEGYLFPETYQLPRHTDARRLVRMMVDRFERVWTAQLHEAAANRGLTTRQAVTLASIVEKETARPEERPLVAAVYENRRRIGMGLQCDPTVIYALQHAGRYTGNLKRDDLAFDSPYNTYKYPGLPPGPIASPGKASLEAAVQPAATGYLYFVSRNDGTHVFASTLAEHSRNVQKFQVQYFRNRRMRANR